MYSLRMLTIGWFSLFGISCGDLQQEHSQLHDFQEVVFLPDNSDPANRIGFDGVGNKIANFGQTIGSEFVIDYGSREIWTPLHRPIKLRGSRVMAVPTLDFNPSFMPVYPDEYDDKPWYLQGCSDDRGDPANHGASFVVRMRYKTNGVEQIRVTPPIPVSHRLAPRYPVTEAPGRVKLEGILDDGTITDLSVEIGMIVPRVAQGTCWEDDGGVSRPLAASGTNFQLRLKQIAIPHAENR